jgi:hypothetical protein
MKQKVFNSMQKIDLKINIHKTKVMDFTGMADSTKINDITLENVLHFLPGKLDNNRW